ncbi:MAG TPA: hypothetical protein VKA46_30985 [Gemmataceae bacterium]|nr:hypothetical protein [Gemmataceae bacterium]
MTELPQQLLKALDESRGQPLQLVDPRTNRAYLLVPADLFSRIQYAEDEGSLDSRQVAHLIAQTMREEDEGDPALESYQKNRESE